ncbi:MAG: 50S ribosomal protein L11 methyltransferase, partial [Desulfotomaculaceae bacterium]|nr:50S ribosomal protein L11 methyltransferase [Desulfotomaculaceae bacterium]
EDWAGAWKKYYKPVRVGRRLVIKPSWEDYQPLAGDLIIEMDPGMAFGSGTHATTALCLRLLEKYVRPGSSVYDIGTGSGILAIAAARLEAGKVRAVDIDPVACKTAAENVAGNNAGTVVSVQQGNLAEPLPYGADLIVANIIANVIAGFAPHAAAALKPGGIFIASGIIRERAEMVRKAFAAAGLAICEEQADGLWIAIAANKEG